jgi:hypothetical protein
MHGLSEQQTEEVRTMGDTAGRQQSPPDMTPTEQARRRRERMVAWMKRMVEAQAVPSILIGITVAGEERFTPFVYSSGIPTEEVPAVLRRMADDWERQARAGEVRHAFDGMTAEDN